MNHQVAAVLEQLVSRAVTSDGWNHVCALCRDADWPGQPKHDNDCPVREAQRLLEQAPTLAHPAYLRDTLYNTSADTANSQDKRIYGRGIVVGVIGALMALDNLTFVQAVALAKTCLPRNVVTECIPVSWHADFADK